jgi:hypothetical protein
MSLGDDLVLTPTWSTTDPGASPRPPRRRASQPVGGLPPLTGGRTVQSADRPGAPRAQREFALGARPPLHGLLVTPYFFPATSRSKRELPLSGANVGSALRPAAERFDGTASTARNCSPAASRSPTTA